MRFVVEFNGHDWAALSIDSGLAYFSRDFVFGRLNCFDFIRQHRGVCVAEYDAA